MKQIYHLSRRTTLPPTFLTTGAWLALALGGCDEPSTNDGPTPTGTAISAAPTSPLATGATAKATAKPTPLRAPRPVPLGSSGPIQPSAPEDTQLMAINYTLAMLAPISGDPPIMDEAYLEKIVKDLTLAVRTGKTGRVGAEPVRLAKGNRKLEFDLGSDCDDRAPAKFISRAGSSLEAAHAAGILVVSCRDKRWECHQSTRDVRDVLCHAAPR